MTTPSSPTREERAALVAWLRKRARYKSAVSRNTTRMGEITALAQQGVYEFVADQVESGEWRTQHEGGSND